MTLRLLITAGLFLLIPVAVVHGALIPQCPSTGCRACDLIKLGNNVIEFLIFFATIIAAMVLAYLGAKSVVAGESAEVGSSIITILVGLVIMLCAWLAVDLIMKTLVGGRIGPWNTIECVSDPSTLSSGGGSTGSGAASGSGSSGSQTPGGTGNGALCPEGNPGCSVSALQAMGLTEAQARVMSCLAMTESGGDPTKVNPRSQACGLFQTVPGNWTRFQASHPSCTSCADAACNAQAAVGLMQGRISRGQSPYADWTCPGCNANAQGCVNRYDPRT